ncbi:MAG: MerR family transcriptional regulator [Rhizobiaceae bacterium]
MDKNPDAFRTISEVADDMDLPQHVLRFWETRFSQIKPMKRGGGRRYYRPGDIDLIKGIRYLLYDQGYTIKGVQKLLKENGNSYVVALGAGNFEAAEAIMASRQASDQLEAEQGVVGKAKAKAGRRFLGLGRSDDDKQPESEEVQDAERLSKDNHALLQETLFDLLECKRLLDQAR